MRACFLCDQNGHFVLNPVLSGSHIGGSVCADGKLAEGQCIMIFQHIVINVLPVFLFTFEAAACIVCNSSFFKGQLQITELQAFQINAAYMEHPFGSLQTG